MHKIIWGGALASVLVAGAIAVRAEDAPATQPAHHATTKPTAAAGHVIEPYGKISDLTDEQKLKIREIHKKALAQESAIKAQETEDITALLTDPQKAELEKLNADKHEKMSEKTAKKKADDAGN